MYSLVLLTAMAGGSGAAHGCCVAKSCCESVCPAIPQGGQVVFFWAGPAGLSEQEDKEWNEYLEALDRDDQEDAKYYWARADRAGKQKLLAQVRVLRADKDKFEAKKREEEMKAKEEERKEIEKKDADKKPDAKKDVKKDAGKKIIEKKVIDK